jgi:deazaflavin-dependent oxidoreductase (nitroreductase family)
MVDNLSGWREFSAARDRFRARLAGQAEVARLESAFALPATPGVFRRASPRIRSIPDPRRSERDMAEDANQPIIDEFRANAGKVGGYFDGADMLLLHSVGARTGKERTNPLLYLNDGGRIIVIASYGGAPQHPDWYYNLLAHPEVTVELGTETKRAVARQVPDAERDRLYAEMVRRRPQFAEYERKTTRRIPVVALTPVD